MAAMAVFERYSSRRKFLAGSAVLAGTAIPGAQALPAMATRPSSPILKLQANSPQHFFDDSLFSHHRRLVRRWLPTYINHEPVMTANRPWEEKNVKLQGTILRVSDGGYRMYYSAAGKVLVAFSPDGLEWTKPELDIIPWKGQRTNILLQGHPWSIAATSVIQDDQDPKYPYKLTSYQRPDKTKPGGLYVYRSAEGLHWEPLPGPHFRMGDANTVMSSRVNGKFVAYIRKDGMFQTVGRRAVFRMESSDLVEWSEPELVLAPDLQDEPDVEFYSLTVFRRHGWFLGLVQNWRSDQDVFDIQLCFSRDGKVWERPQPRGPFIAPTYDWNRGNTATPSNGPIYLNEQMAFYIGGGSTAHHSTTTRPKDTVIGLASLELDRFCALEGTTSLGWIDTIPMVWPGGSLVVNADTRESFNSHPTYTNGELFVEVLDESAKPLPDWSGKQRALFQGNTHSRETIHDGTVRWPNGRSLQEFAGKAIRLRFGMKHARLFTFDAKK
jgi:hypothetical protein